jgi:hypothetical protein
MCRNLVSSAVSLSPCPLYPRKADMCGAARDVRFGPKADIARFGDEPPKCYQRPGSPYGRSGYGKLIPGPYGYLEVPPGANAGIRETSARDVVTLWCFTTALRECRDPWAAKLVPEIESSRAKASVRKWNLVSTTIAASIADSGMEYVTHQDRKRVGRWSNKDG